MAGRFASALLACAVAGTAGGVAGCGSSAQGPDDGGMQDADFVQCADSPAVDYMAGLTATSMSGAYVATLVSATTDFSDGTSAATAASGLDTWVVTIADATAGTPADVTMTAERPFMPKHNHGATTYPTVTAGDPGMFTVSEMNLFMLGYWSEVLDLQPAPGAADASATADKVTFAICVRQ